jgi:hypothetical protein
MRRVAFCCSALAMLALALPSAGAAGPLDIPSAVPPQFRALVRKRLHRPRPRAASEYRFDLEARKGYKVSVIGEGNIVALEVIRVRNQKSARGRSFLRSGAVTVYVARGTVTPHRLAASFGAMGRVAMRFRPSGRIAKSKPRRHCRGADHFTSRLGVFVGNLRFKGEDRYLSLHVHRAKGHIRSPLHLHCGGFHFRSIEGRGEAAGRKARPVRELPVFTPTILAATDRHGVSAVELLAFQIGKRTLFLAIDEQSHGSTAEVRYAISLSKTKAFTFNEALTSATLQPPKPFRGKGSYRAAADGTSSWSGSLSASFPGLSRLSLAGPEFETALVSGF